MALVNAMAEARRVVTLALEARDKAGIQGSASRSQ